MDLGLLHFAMSNLAGIFKIYDNNHMKICIEEEWVLLQTAQLAAACSSISLFVI